MGLKESILEALEVVYEMLELILCTIELMMFVVGVASMSWFLLVVSVREWLMLFVHNNVASGVMVLKLGAFVCCVILLEKETVCTCCSSSKKGLHACGSPSTIYILKRQPEIVSVRNQNATKNCFSTQPETDWCKSLFFMQPENLNPNPRSKQREDENSGETEGKIPIRDQNSGDIPLRGERVAATRGGSGAVDEDEDTEEKNGRGSNDEGLADLERLGHLERLGDGDLERWI
ncbi:hypothetical protein LR48_Vigan03g167500 [Vigna angularis]|uniref:Uncharacterized protein n=1 Tax=Phaseolus angularis TaxID=3914 RepID=A0A0L9U636_PHAAN|nr:hypothetical protein LR48_Vigan03g167500 [Vigna angularis]